MSGLRVTAGSLRGRVIPLPPHDVRPTSEKARQAFFNIISERIEGAAFLDLFCGSGIFSIEAISRGAASSTAVDQSRRAIHALEERARQLELPVRTLNSDSIAALRRLGEGAPFDIVYADPPYAYPEYGKLLSTIDSLLALAPEAIVAIEHSRGPIPFDPGTPSTLAFRKTVLHGNVAITIFDKLERQT